MSPIILCTIISLLSCTAVFSQEAPLFLQHDAASNEAGCVDLDERCAAWSGQGECARNAAWMMQNCRRSCKSCQGGDRAWSLRTHLAERYNTSGQQQNNTANVVYVSSVALDHITVNEPQQIIQLHGQIVFTWNDSRVSWDKEKWDLSWLNFYWLQIWTPDIEQKNEPNPLYAGRITRKILAANYTGQVYMWTDVSLSVACSMDYSDYPHDTHTCCAQLDDKKYYAVRFQVLDAARNAMHRHMAGVHMSGWTLQDVEMKSNAYKVSVLKDWSEDPFGLESTNCALCVTLRRRANFYAAEMVLPAVATAVITLVSFVAANSWWPQIWLIIASLLLQIASMMVLALKLPNGTIGTPNIVCFGAFNLIASMVALVLSVLYRRLAAHLSPIPPPHTVDMLVKAVLKVAPCLADDRPLDDGLSPDKQQQQQTQGGNQPYWAPLASLLNRLTFVLLLAVYVVMITAKFIV